MVPWREGKAIEQICVDVLDAQEKPSGDGLTG